MHRRMRIVMVGLVLALFAALSAPRLSAQTGTVTCESKGSSREQCAVQRDATVELARQLSDTPCRREVNWGQGPAYIWVSGGCRAEFTVTAGYAGVPASNASATPVQLRACRVEADRRLPGYTYGQIGVEPQSRKGSVAEVRWWTATSAGLCSVATDGRILRFSTGGTPGPSGGYATPATTTQLTCESQSTGREECPIPQGAQVRLVRQISQSPCRLNDTYGTGQGYVWVAKGLSCRVRGDRGRRCACHRSGHRTDHGRRVRHDQQGRLSVGRQRAAGVPDPRRGERADGQAGHHRRLPGG
jgi:hypothetical protein